MRYFGKGETICPVCMSQVDVQRKELEQAREFQISEGELRRSAAELLKRRAISPAEAGVAGSRRPMLETNPNRRAVFRMLGIYLPEREAKALLQNVHEYKWIEAEKAGYDVWQADESPCPLTLAARQWARKHLDQFLAWQQARRTNWSQSPPQPA